MAEKALLQILAGQYSGMPVIDGISRVVGIISEFDLLKAIQKKLVLNATPIEQIMTQSPMTVDVKDGLETVLDIMIQKGFIRVPVTEQGKLAGIISRSDILMAYYSSSGKSA